LKVYVDWHTKRKVHKMLVFNMLITVCLSCIFNHAAMAEDQEFI